jgi:hypothetical protein
MQNIDNKEINVNEIRGAQHIAVTLHPLFRMTSHCTDTRIFREERTRQQEPWNFCMRRSLDGTFASNEIQPCRTRTSAWTVRFFTFTCAVPPDNEI